ALLALFLALAKRRGELVLVQAEEAPGRAALSGYSPRLVDVSLGVVAAATALTYAAYAVSAHNAWMELTVPFVVLCPRRHLVRLRRYLSLAHRHYLGEGPVHVLLVDRVVLGPVAGWAVVSAVVLAVT